MKSMTALTILAYSRCSLKDKFIAILIDENMFFLLLFAFADWIIYISNFLC